MQPKISLIYRFYNDEKYLSESIESYINQTLKETELILYNNASTDNSLSIAEKYAKQDPRIKILHSQKNYIAGSHSIREMLKFTKGKYIKLFCADDVMLPNCLETSYNFLENNPDLIACFANMQIIDENSKKINKTANVPIRKNKFEYLNHIFYHHNAFIFPTFMIRKEYLTPDMVDPRLTQFFDVKLWIETLKKGEVGIINEILVNYRKQTGDQNISNTKKNAKKLKSYLFELHLMYDEFFKIDNFELFSKTFPESQNFLDRLDPKSDKELIPFLTAITLYNSEKYYPFCFSLHRNIALLKMFEIIKDEKIANKIEEKLNISYQDLSDLTGEFFDGIKVEYKFRRNNIILKPIFKILKRIFLRNLRKNKSKIILK